MPITWHVSIIQPLKNVGWDAVKLHTGKSKWKLLCSGKDFRVQWLDCTLHLKSKEFPKRTSALWQKRVPIAKTHVEKFQLSQKELQRDAQDFLPVIGDNSWLDDPDLSWRQLLIQLYSQLQQTLMVPLWLVMRAEKCIIPPCFAVELSHWPKWQFQLAIAGLWLTLRRSPIGQYILLPADPLGQPKSQFFWHRILIVSWMHVKFFYRQMNCCFL